MVDYFIPSNVNALDGADSDFGSGAPVMLPDSAGIPGHPHLMIVGGKDGRLFVVDRDNLGHYDPVNDHVLNAVPNSSGGMTPIAQTGGTLNTPTWYNGKFYVTSGYLGNAKAFTLRPNGTLTPSASAREPSFGYLPGGPLVSSNGTSNGIVWMMDRSANQIHAYDASSLSNELWNSGGSYDTLGAVVRFAEPTVVNGHVYVGTTNSLVAYGLTPPPGTVPVVPVLTATTLSGSSINLTWTDASVAPNIANGYSIEESTDNKTFTVVTTAPATATSIAIGGLAAQTLYYFRIRGFDAVGNSAYSTVVSATTLSKVAGISYPNGFTSPDPQLSLNGSTVVQAGVLQLTDGAANEAGSAFTTSPVDISKFNTQFTFQTTAGQTTGEGFTFTLQNVAPDGAGAIGRRPRLWRGQLGRHGRNRQ